MLYIPSTASNVQITTTKKMDILFQPFDDEDFNSNLESVESYLIRGNKLQAAKRLRQLNPGTSFQEAIKVVTAFKRVIEKQSAN